MPIKIDRLWAGTEDSLNDLLARMQAVTPETVSMVEAKRAAYDDEGESRDKRTSRLVQRVGTTGVVQIKGSLVNSDDAFWNEFFGLVGYGEIREAVLELALDPSVTSILLDIDSGGGQVNGMSDVAEVLATVDAKYKPVFAHTGGGMMSAAYYVGSTARQLTASSMAEVGSIGVLIVHKSVARALQQNGIDVTVIRAGEFKALGNPFEELSDTAKADLQKRCDYSYDLFLQHVAERRGVMKSYAKDTMGEGRVFIGQQAVDVGLVDALGSIDFALQGAEVAKTPDYLQHGLSASEQQQDMAQKLTPLYAAARQMALQAGKAQASAGAGDETDEAKAAALAAAAAAVVEAEAAETEAAETKPSTEADPRLAELEAVNGDLKAQAKVLTQQASELNAQLVAQKVEAAGVADKLKAAGKHREALHAIAAAAVDHLNIALGRSGGQASQLSDEQVVAEHARLSAEFDASFKAGGVAVVSAKGEGAEKPDPLKSARRNAARLK